MREWLYDLRKAHKLTQFALATKLNVTGQTVWNWEHGKMNISFPSLLALANIFGIGVDLISLQERDYLEKEI